MIAGDMFHEFQDAQGNLYGIGTEVGDFRVRRISIPIISSITNTCLKVVPTVMWKI